MSALKKSTVAFEKQNEIRLRRLKELREMMKNHKKLFKKTAYFDIDVFAVGGLKAVNSKGKCEAIEDGSCGTAACVLGSAALHKPFNKEGLYLKSEYNTRKGTKVLSASPHYMGEEDFDAGAKFFKITMAEADYLFDPQSYNSIISKPVTPNMAIRHITALINHYTKNPDKKSKWTKAKEKEESTYL